jgi:ATP-dependent RNA helicase DeaD
MVVLDEADEMLDMGFAEDLDAILRMTPATRQTALFSPRCRRGSSRSPSSICAIRAHRDRARAHAGRRGAARAPGRVRRAAPAEARALGRVLDMESPSSAIVFCRTRVEVDELTRR